MINRFIEESLNSALSSFRVVLLAGARQVGKSTLVKQICNEQGRSYITLDSLAARSAAQRDPEGFVNGLTLPTAIDEIQKVPELLDAIKQKVDSDQTRGQYLLTGSADVFQISRVSDSLAGRVATIKMGPLTLAERLEGESTPLIDALFAGPQDIRLGPPDKVSVPESMIQGGFPEPVIEKMTQEWFDHYLTSVLERDVRDIASIDTASELPTLLKHIAARTGRTVNVASLARDSRLSERTLGRYATILQRLFLVHEVTPWFRNVTKRLVKSPKWFIADSGLTAYLLNLDQDAIEKDPAKAGLLFESFVLNELLRHLSWSETRAELFHMRAHSGEEVDFVLESADQRVIGLELKWRTTLKPDSDLKGLEALKSMAKDQFGRGYVLYLGNDMIPLGRDITALPVRSLWA